MKPWQLGALFACIVILSVGSVAGIVLWVTERSDDRLAGELADSRTAQLEACERGNALRRRVSANSEALKEFALAAAAARSASAASATDPKEIARDSGAAARYRGIAERMEPTPEIDCVSIIKRVEGR